MVAQTKAELMQQTRKRMKEAGLVKLELWVTPEQKEELKKIARRS